MSLITHGGNSRYVKLMADQLVKVPDDIEPGEAACLIETYLSAFQAVHCGQRLNLRYRKQSLCGKSILIMGALTNVGRALVELANAGGATLVYAPCKEKHRDKIRELGATPLSLKKREWSPMLQNKLDLVVDATVDIDGVGENYFNLLSDKGDLVFIGRNQDRVDAVTEKWVGGNKLACSSLRARMSNQTHAYDVFDKWETDLDFCKVRRLNHFVEPMLLCVTFAELTQLFF